MSLDGGRKPEIPERTHGDTGRTCTLFTERPEYKINHKTKFPKACINLLICAVCRVCVSQELLFNPDINASDLMKHMDLVLLSDWTQQAQHKVISFVQRDVSSQLNKIQKTDRETCQTEEDYVGLYIHVIKCIEAAPNEAQKFSSELSLKLTEVCLKELLGFVTSYKSYRLETLTKDKMANPDLVSVFKNLKTCKELKSHMTQTKFKSSRVISTVGEIVALLEEIEEFSFEHLMKIVTDFTERNLKTYFKSNNKLCFFMTDLEKLLKPEPWLCLDEHQHAMDEAYKLIVRFYSKHLISHKLSKLEKCWSPDVAQSVAEDAELLHKIISDLCPGVKRWNVLLLYIKDLLQTSDINTLKLSTAVLLEESLKKTSKDDAQLLYRLLRWKGWSRRNIREVVSALEEILDPDLVFPKSWYSFCFG